MLHAGCSLLTRILKSRKGRINVDKKERRTDRENVTERQNKISDKNWMNEKAGKTYRIVRNNHGKKQ